MARRRKNPGPVNVWLRSEAVRNFLALHSLTSEEWPANRRFRAILCGKKTLGYIRKRISEESALRQLTNLLAMVQEHGS